jgi:hypothetical protein
MGQRGTERGCSGIHRSGVCSTASPVRRVWAEDRRTNTTVEHPSEIPLEVVVLRTGPTVSPTVEADNEVVAPVGRRILNIRCDQDGVSPDERPDRHAPLTSAKLHLRGPSNCVSGATFPAIPSLSGRSLRVSGERSCSSESRRRGSKLNPAGGPVVRAEGCLARAPGSQPTEEARSAGDQLHLDSSPSPPHRQS